MTEEANDALAQLTTLRSQVEQARQLMKDAAQKVVKESTKAIFAEYGDILDSFGWLQYTPYFNDGDPCEFGMYELSLIAKSDVAAAEEDGDDLYNVRREWAYESSPAFSTWGGSGKSKVSSTYGEPREGDPRYDACLGACLQVYEALSTDQSIAKDIFGDHVRVIFTPDGVDVEEYDHD